MAFSANGVLATQSKSFSRDIVASYWINGQNIKVYDAKTTTVEEYCGMSEASALTLAATLYSNGLADYRIRSSSTSPFSWILVPSAKGSLVTATAARQGTSRMFTVTKVTEVHVCSNSAGWTEY